MNRASSVGASSRKRTLSPSGQSSAIRRKAVDMARDQMAAELVAKRQGPLEIDARAVLPAPSVVRGQGLVGDVDLEHGAGAFAEPGHCEAAAVAGDRGALDEAGGVVVAGDAKPRSRRARRACLCR